MEESRSSSSSSARGSSVEGVRVLISGGESRPSSREEKVLGSPAGTGRNSARFLSQGGLEGEGKMSSTDGSLAAAVGMAAIGEEDEEEEDDDYAAVALPSPKMRADTFGTQFKKNFGKKFSEPKEWKNSKTPFFKGKPQTKTDIKMSNPNR
eukprot:CAMPEP_0175155112 /NCGR_PEP_ID=MMETSP0087-20121206/20774_1 /TAXON_ID=136419 /ORGANISM="Unknown Unknown, Strain D1" /LENGTH=150 /DNA_ID=CAMNT_0016442191 /DNA_START=19 /DNA_END=468 /DNA_ORIENTATION=-